jgi:UrcA family protein
MTKFAFLTAAVVAAAVAQGASAQNFRYPLIERSVQVSYKDLNLSKPGDARVMLGRLEIAARVSCGFMPERDRAFSVSHQFIRKDFTGCTETALAKAVANLHAPMVLRAYAESKSAPLRQAQR